MLMTWRRSAISTLSFAALAVFGCASQSPPPAPPTTVVLLPGSATQVASPYPVATVLRETRGVGHGVGQGLSARNESVEDSPSDDDQVDDDQVADTDPSALEDFEADLEPYGEWLEDPYYGTVWVPYEQAVGTQFVPYLSAGR